MEWNIKFESSDRNHRIIQYFADTLTASISYPITYKKLKNAAVEKLKEYNAIYIPEYGIQFETEEDMTRFILEWA